MDREILDQIDIDYFDLASKLGIKKGRVAGLNMYTRCPIHHDRSPSFSLNIQTGLWICFAGCGSGDFGQLVQRVLECTAKQAEVWILENAAGVDSEQLKKDIAESVGTQPEVDDSLQDWAQRWGSLSDNVMPLWLLQRGFNWATIQDFGLRWDGIREQVVIRVPPTGDVLLGTISRNVRPEAHPKYVNSPGLPVGKLLFGLCNSGENTIILVEGPLDAMWLYQCGLSAAALLGTRLSKRQIEILHVAGIEKVILAMDGDKAGADSQAMHIQVLLKAGWLREQIRLVEYPEGTKDVQECGSEQIAVMMSNLQEV